MMKTIDVTLKVGFLICAVFSSIASSSASASAPEPLWSMVERLAAATKEGGHALVNQWPGASLSLPTERSGKLHIVDGGGFTIEKDSLVATGSELRLSDTGKARLVIVRLQGNCITPNDIMDRYPKNEAVNFPQPNNPNPVSYRRIYLEGVRVSFGFRGSQSSCLTDMIFNANT